MIFAWAGGIQANCHNHFFKTFKHHCDNTFQDPIHFDPGCATSFKSTVPPKPIPVGHQEDVTLLDSVVMAKENVQNRTFSDHLSQNQTSNFDGYFLACQISSSSFCDIPWAKHYNDFLIMFSRHKNIIRDSIFIFQPEKYPGRAGIGKYGFSGSQSPLPTISVRPTPPPIGWPLDIEAPTPKLLEPH